MKGTIRTLTEKVSIMRTQIDIISLQSGNIDKAVSERIALLEKQVLERLDKITKQIDAITNRLNALEVKKTVKKSTTPTKI